jgi:hypothetical protein
MSLADSVDGPQPPSVAIVVDDGFNIERSGNLAAPLPLPQGEDPAKSPAAYAIAQKNQNFDRYTGFDGFDDDATATFFVSKAVAEQHADTGTVEVDLVLPSGVPSAGPTAVIFDCTKLAATCKAFPRCGPGQHVNSATCSCVSSSSSATCLTLTCKPGKHCDQASGTAQCVPN